MVFKSVICLQKWGELSSKSVASCLLKWGELSSKVGRVVFLKWGELSWGEFYVGRVVLGRLVFGASCPDSIMNTMLSPGVAHLSIV